MFQLHVNGPGRPLRAVGEQKVLSWTGRVHSHESLMDLIKPQPAAINSDQLQFLLCFGKNKCKYS